MGNYWTLCVESSSSPFITCGSPLRLESSPSSALSLLVAAGVDVRKSDAAIPPCVARVSQPGASFFARPFDPLAFASTFSYSSAWCFCGHRIDAHTSARGLRATCVLPGLFITIAHAILIHVFVSIVNRTLWNAVRWCLTCHGCISSHSVTLRFLFLRVVKCGMVTVGIGSTFPQT